MTNKVKLIRKKKKLRQVDLAAAVGRPVQIISYIENELFIPDEELKKELAQALGIKKVQELFSE